MAKEYVARFSDGPDRYVAYGQDKDYLPVFHVRSGAHVKTMMRYPSCLKFLTYATVRALRRMTSAEIKQLYGEPLPAKAPVAQP